MYFYFNYLVVLLENVINSRNATKKTPSSTTIPKYSYCFILCFYNKMFVAELRFFVVLQLTRKQITFILQSSTSNSIFFLKT